jgi:hypothetical protein
MKFFVSLTVGLIKNVETHFKMSALKTFPAKDVRII